MPRNGAITAFFKPVSKQSDPQSQSQSPSQTQPEFRSYSHSHSHSRVPVPAPSPSPAPAPALPSVAPSSTPSSTPSSPASLSLLLSSPPVPTSLVRDRNAVIRGSDDDDDDDDDDDLISSDDDLPSLFARPNGNGNVVPVPPARRGPVWATPRAKRTALEFHSSPLTIMPKHKFDMKALMQHAKADNAAEASAQRIESLLARESAATAKSTATAAAVAAASSTSTTSASGGVDDRGGSERQLSLHDTMLDVFSDAEGSHEEGTRNKLLRAVKRTEITINRKQWNFFDRHHRQDHGSPSVEVRNPFPHVAAKDVWAFLAPTESRREYFEDGLPYNVQVRLQNLPDEIFLWVLREIPAEKVRKLREEYIRLLGVCPDRAGRLVDRELIDLLFRDVGASDRAFSSPSQPTGEMGGLEQRDLHMNRDLTPLRSVLRSLTEMSQGLSLPALSRSVTILLRLGMDSLVREDQAVARDFQDALHWLAHGVPGRSWDDFCGDVCASLHAHVSEACLRCDAAASIPPLSSRLVDLRRRLALISVFDDPQRGRTSPEVSFSLRDIAVLLDSAPEFRVNRNHADFFELAALAELLGFAIGDGCPPLSPPPPTGNTTATTVKTATTTALHKKFNKDVDEVAGRIKVMWSSIHGQGAAFASRLDAKVTLQDLERKLQHATRTRPPPRVGPFGIDHDEDEEEVERPKQQRFMKRFLQSKERVPPPKTP